MHVNRNSHAARPRRYKVLVCLTAIPSRLKYLPATIRTLLHQTQPPDRIYLFLPSFSSKEQCSYWPLPNELQRVHEESGGLLDIVDCGEDLGPITKLLPVLSLVPVTDDEHTLIVTVDDDRLYSPRMLESLLAGYRRHPECRIALTGWIMGGSMPPTFLHRWVMLTQHGPGGPDIEVDTVEATSAALYPCHHLRAVESKLHDFRECPEARWCDDIWISGHLSAAPMHEQAFVVPLLDHERGRVDRTPAASVNALSLGTTHQLASDAERLDDNPKQGLWARLALRGRLTMAQRNRRVFLHFRRRYPGAFTAPTPDMGKLRRELDGHAWSWTDIAAFAAVLVFLLLAGLLTLIILTVNRRQQAPQRSRLMSNPPSPPEAMLV